MTEHALSAVERAQLLISVGRYAEAVSRLQAHLARQPGDVQAMCVLARAQYGAGNPTQAYRQSQHAIEADPENEWAHRLASIAARGLGRHAESLRHARASVELAPQQWEPHVVLAEALAANGHRSPAREAAWQAVALAPHEPDAHLTVGSTELALGELAAAQAGYHEALALVPEHQAALANLVLVTIRRGQLAAAAPLLAAALRNDPNSQSLHGHLGRLSTLLLFRLAGLLAASGVALGTLVLLAGPPWWLRVPPLVAVVAALARYARHVLRPIPLRGRYRRQLAEHGRPLRGLAVLTLAGTLAEAVLPAPAGRYAAVCTLVTGFVLLLGTLPALRTYRRVPPRDDPE